VALELRPPDGIKLDLARWQSFYQRLFGIAAPWWRRLLVGEPHLTFGYVIRDQTAVASCWCPERLELVVRSHLASAVPGIEVTQTAIEVELGEVAVRSRIGLWREALYPLGEGDGDALEGVIGPLTAATWAAVQVAIEPDVTWQARAGKRLDQLSGVQPARNPLSAALAELIDIFFGSFTPSVNGSTAASPVKRPSQPNAPSDKAFEVGYRVAIRLYVASDSKAVAKGLMHSAVSALRGLEGHNGLRPRRVWLGSTFDRQLKARPAPGSKDMVLAPKELAQLFHVPCGGTLLETAPVKLIPRRLSRVVDGKVICLAEDPRRTPIVLRQADARQHCAATGPTGAGKSVLVGNLVLDDVQLEQGAGVVDPKGDLVRAVLERIPDERADNVVLFDPTHADWPVGLNILACPDPEMQELVCDQVVTIFRKNFERYWGPRTDDVLRAALLTLMRSSAEATLCDVPLLLLKPEARRAYRKSVESDPGGLDLFWHEYERMGESQRLQMVGPVLNKLRSFLMRRTVRNVVGQTESTLDIPQILDSGKLLLVSLPKGLLGEETSRLLGSFIVARIWQAAMARADRPEEERRDFTLYLDEFQNYLNLSHNIDDLLVEARGYRLSLFLAHQHLGQLNPSTRDALSANVHTRIVFQCGSDDARLLARDYEPWLGERELRNLQRFQVAARICVNGRTEAPLTGVTRPLPPSLGAAHADEIAQASVRRYGRPRAQVEREINERLRRRWTYSDLDDVA
jgi:hypothetical protein